MASLRRAAAKKNAPRRRKGAQRGERRNQTWVHNPKRINRDGQDEQDSCKGIFILRILSIPVNSLRTTQIQNPMHSANDGSLTRQQDPSTRLRLAQDAPSAAADEGDDFDFVAAI